MSYTISASIGDLRRRLADAREVERLYPDASYDTLPGGGSVLVAKSVVPTSVTVGAATCDGRSDVYFFPYATVGGTRVYLEPSMGWATGWAILARLADKRPDAFAAIVAAATEMPLPPLEVEPGNAQVVIGIEAITEEFASWIEDLLPTYGHLGSDVIETLCEVARAIREGKWRDK